MVLWWTTPWKVPDIRTITQVICTVFTPFLSHKAWRWIFHFMIFNWRKTIGNAGKYTKSYLFNPEENKYFVDIFFNGCLPVNHNAFLWYTKRFLEPLLGRKVRWNICVEEQIISGEKKTRTFLDLIGARGVYHLSNIFRNAHRIKKIGKYHSDIPYSKQ